MANPDNSGNKALGMIKHALRQIQKHPHVVNIGTIKRDNGIYQVPISIKVNIPIVERPSGKSQTGVRLVEPVDFRFQEDYPSNPPRIFLRPDFNRSLPHIQPCLAGSPVEPCYYDGDPRELLHWQGISAIANQIVHWLERAAKNELTDLEHGWEPIRRDLDQVKGCAIAEHESLRALAVRRQTIFQFLSANVMKYLLPSNNQGCYFYNWVIPKSVPINQTKLETIQRPLFSKKVQYIKSFAILVSSGRLPSGKPYICDQYTPETVNNLDELIKRASDYDCGKKLENAISLLKKLAICPMRNISTAPILVILCARRPAHLIGSNSDLELIPYTLETPVPMFASAPDSIPVHPIALQHAISPNLLQSMSGINTPDERILVQLGCGSLGSKIALHMARAGLAPHMVVDKQNMSPHNAARHALVPSKEYPHIWMLPKADVLADAINGLGQSVLAKNIDVVSLVTEEKQLLKKAWAVVNATASLAVRDTLGVLDATKMPARVVEVSLFAGCSIGLMTVEGPGRSPNTSDLIREAYEIVREDEAIRERFFVGNGRLRRQETGQGCSSLTMIATDADISLFSASMARKILELRQQELPEAGQVIIGKLDPDGLGLTWKSLDVEPFHCIQAENDRSWQIRISPRVQQAVSDECERYDDVETGGIIMGTTSQTRKAITITNVLPAPADSERSKTLFTLGTHGVSELVEDYKKSTNYNINCVGTWHSHLQETGGSPRDYETASMISTKSMEPMVLLIKTPCSYRAIVASKIHSKRP